MSASYTGYLDQSYDLSTFTPGVSTINATDTELRFLSFTAYQSAIFTSTSNSDYFIINVSSYTSSTGNIQGTVVYKSGSSTSTRWVSNLSAVGIGSSGTSGVNGSAGTSGVNGSSGTSGFNGSSGTSGFNGSSGTSGTSGSSGSSGTAGTSGTSGVSITGPTGPTGAAGSGGTSTLYNSVARYQAYASGSAAVWLTSSSTMNSGLSWTRSSTTVTITRNNHGHSNGDAIIIRNVNVDNEWCTISNVATNTFDITVSSSSGAASGSSAAYMLTFTITSASASGSTLVAPSGGDVVLISAYFASGSRSGTTYAFTTPTSALNGAGANTSVSNAYFPILRAQDLVAGTVANITMTVATASNFNVFTFGGLSASNNTGIRASF